jgi:hypothetical protein
MDRSDKSLGKQLPDEPQLNCKHERLAAKLILAYATLPLPLNRPMRLSTPSTRQSDHPMMLFLTESIPGVCQVVAACSLTCMPVFCPVWGIVWMTVIRRG